MLFKKKLGTIKFWVQQKFYGHRNWKFKKKNFKKRLWIKKDSKEIFGKKYFECKKACIKKKMLCVMKKTRLGLQCQTLV